MWADSTHGVPNPYSNDFIKKIHENSMAGNNGEKRGITENGRRIGEREEEEKKEMEEKKKETNKEKEEEEEEVVSVSEGRSGWLNDTMAIMLQIPVEKFKVHDHIRLMNNCLASKDSDDVKDCESNINSYNNNGINISVDNESNGCNYDCNKNRNNHDTIIPNTPILNHTITNNINSNKHKSPINAMNYSSNIDNYDKNMINKDLTKNHFDISDESTKNLTKIRENEDSKYHNVFIRQKEHTLKNKNEVIIAAMRALHCVMQIHDENVKNSKIAGDQVE